VRGRAHVYVYAHDLGLPLPSLTRRPHRRFSRSTAPLASVVASGVSLTHPWRTLTSRMSYLSPPPRSPPRSTRPPRDPRHR